MNLAIVGANSGLAATRDWGVQYDNYAEGLYLSIDSPTIPIAESIASIVSSNPIILIDSVSIATASSVSAIIIHTPYITITVGL